MLVHSVYFWLRDGLSCGELEEFRAGLESLAAIPGVAALHIGAPAPTPPRPVVIADYTLGITALMDGMETHDAYQTHPLHLAFLKQFSPMWTRVQVYDFM